MVPKGYSWVKVLAAIPSCWLVVPFACRHQACHIELSCPCWTVNKDLQHSSRTLALWYRSGISPCSGGKSSAALMVGHKLPFGSSAAEPRHAEPDRASSAMLWTDDEWRACFCTTWSSWATKCLAASMSWLGPLQTVAVEVLDALVGERDEGLVVRRALRTGV